MSALAGPLRIPNSQIEGFVFMLHLDPSVCSILHITGARHGLSGALFVPSERDYAAVDSALVVVLAIPNQ